MGAVVVVMQLAVDEVEMAPALRGIGVVVTRV
jgi:hypothetical protein